MKCELCGDGVQVPAVFRANGKGPGIKPVWLCRAHLASHSDAVIDADVADIVAIIAKS